MVFITGEGLSQDVQKEIKKPLPNQVPSKKQMQNEMQSAINEVNAQIADLEKKLAEAIANNEDEETIKDLRDQITMLKKQVQMVGGLNKSVSGMSEKTFKQAGEKEPLVPKKDAARINMLPKKVLTETQVVLLISKVHAQVEKMIPPAEKAEAIEIYNENKKVRNSVAVIANAASGCWMLGHWEKALYLMGRACMDDINDADNLNNYASFLISTGAEQAALPILEYLNDLYPGNSTIINNIGQAWFGLGDITNSKKWLSDATVVYGNHSQANSTLCAIYKSEGNTTKAIEVLKASLKETYDPEKEHELNRLGVQIKYSDLPDLSYPIKDDPSNVIALLNMLPEEYPAGIGDDDKVDKIDRFLNGVHTLREKLRVESDALDEQAVAQSKELVMDDQFRNEYLEAHNTPAYKLAHRSLQLLIAERQAGMAALPVQLLGPGLKPFGRNENIMTSLEIITECDRIWRKEVVEPVAALALAMQGSGHGNPTCSDVDAVTNAYMAKKAAFEKAGTQKIKQMVAQNKKQITNWAKTYYYGVQDQPYKGKNSVDDLTGLVVNKSKFTIHRERVRNADLDAFLGKAEQIVKRQEFIKSSCAPGGDSRLHTEGEDDLAPLISDLDCEFKKVVNMPVLVYTFTCNIKSEKPKKLKKRKPDIAKGSASSSNRGNQNNGTDVLYSPTSTALFITNAWNGRVNDRLDYAPLNSEDKDPSQFSIEYDKWGNIIDIKFQLNETSTGLADPDSKETGIESRWTWNAIASPKKGFLNKLVTR
jgi:hypothetical protein